MDTMGERLVFARERLNKTQSEIAQAVGMAQPSYYKLESGKTKKTSYINKLASALKVDVDWLESGIGEVTGGQYSSDDVGFVYKSVGIDYGDSDGVDIPVYNVVFCCGDGNDADYSYEEIKGYRKFNTGFFADKGVDVQHFKLLCAKNDSMSPYIKDGDEVGIDISDTKVRDGEVYALLLDGERMFKQIFREGGGVLRLHSYNARYPDKLIDHTNGESMKIIGRQIYRAG